MVKKFSRTLLYILVILGGIILAMVLISNKTLSKNLPEKEPTELQ